MKVWLVGSIAATMLAAFALEAQAQDAPAPAAEPAAAAAPAAMTSGYSDDELTKFAALAVKINAISAAGGDDVQTKLVAAVQDSGLPFETYNAIATKMSTDQALQKRVSELAPQPQS